MKKVSIPGSDKQVYCDVTKERPRPYVTQSFRRQVFLSLLGLAQSEIKATIKLFMTIHMDRHKERLHAMDTNMRAKKQKSAGTTKLQLEGS